MNRFKSSMYLVDNLFLQEKTQKERINLSKQQKKILHENQSYHLI